MVRHEIYVREGGCESLPQIPNYWLSTGAFLFPFLLCLLLFGLPLNFLEMSLGQFTGKSPLHVWNDCPLVKGNVFFSQSLCTTALW